MPRCSPGLSPRLPPVHLPRPRLVERLAERDIRLRLLCAPAGFGKSVLLGEYLQALPDDNRILWLSLAGQPLDAGQLLAQVAQALDSPIPDGAPVNALLQLIELHSEPLWLVLDDYPNHPSAELDACIDLLLARAPSRLQLLVSARQRPTWNLPRLLLAGELMELDCSELACTRDELELLVTQLVPQATPDLHEELWQQTEGWCAGIRLLLSGKTLPSGTSQGQSGSQCWLRDYLEHELLARLSPEEARCLCALVQLPKVSAELCQSLWEESDGAALFNQLLLGQAFFIPLDDDGLWYRVLPVVARGLRNRLGAAATTQLHLRACRIFIAAGQVEEAIEQALCAGQLEVAANYLERLSQEWLTGEQHLAHLFAWRERLPPLLLDSTPRLLALNAWALLLAWRLDEAQACIERLTHFLPQPDAWRQRKLLANTQALQGMLAAQRGTAGPARAHCQDALAHLSERDWMPALLCHSTLARVAMASGHPEQAPNHLHAGVELARRQGSLLFEVLINLDRIRLLLLRGELSRAQVLLQQSFGLIGRRGGIDSLLLGRLNLIQAELHLLHGRAQDCEDFLRAGLKQALACADPFALHGYLGLAELTSRAGQFDQAYVHLREAERHMHCAHAWRLSYRGVLTLQSMRVLSRQGHWLRLAPIAVRIQRYFQDDKPWIVTLEYPALPLRNALLQARAQLAAGQPEQAEDSLQTLLERCETLHFKPLALEVQFALAQARQSLGQVDAIAQELDARQQAEHLGLHGLLQDWPLAHGNAATRVLPASAEAIPGDGTALLSQRERSVLQLLAEGFSNQEIGTYLFISVNTVKTHTKKINSKLGVKRRTQAVMRAKSLGLLV
ncbi:MAG TPA: LuxR C-terminal-related transcriptional regulator [Pseudomonas sp.]|nr:LuxR C-terminal-related transcriptional regulator [Pseudomonas sp.]